MESEIQHELLATHNKISKFCYKHLTEAINKLELVAHVRETLEALQETITTFLERYK